jgi:hypothetical protein
MTLDLTDDEVGVAAPGATLSTPERKCIGEPE